MIINILTYPCKTPYCLSWYQEPVPERRDIPGKVMLCICEMSGNAMHLRNAWKCFCFRNIRWICDLQLLRKSPLLWLIMFSFVDDYDHHVSEIWYLCQLLPSLHFPKYQVPNSSFQTLFHKSFCHKIKLAATNPIDFHHQKNPKLEKSFALWSYLLCKWVIFCALVW